MDITEQDFQELKGDISDIKDALLGSKYNPTGIVHRVSSLEEDLENFSKVLDNREAIQSLKDRLFDIERGIKLWMTVVNNKWVVALIVFTLYALSIQELRTALLKIIGIIV